MPTTYKVLGQSAPAATTNTDLYTVPAGASAVCSTLAICNRSASTTFRVAVRPAGAALVNPHYIVFDNWVNQYDTVFLTLGVTLAAGDVVTVFAGAANLSFSLFGSEIS
jgi:membrane protein YqaA with SNARE-associated domain